MSKTVRFKERNDNDIDVFYNSYYTGMEHIFNILQKYRENNNIDITDINRIVQQLKSDITDLKKKKRHNKDTIKLDYLLQQLNFIVKNIPKNNSNKRNLNILFQIKEYNLKVY
jgi:hypothetical protein